MSKLEQIKILREKIYNDIENIGGVEYFNNYPCANEYIISYIDRILDILEDIIYLKDDNKLDKATLIDFFITSVEEEQEPIWTEEHIEELLDNFDVISKEDK